MSRIPQGLRRRPRTVLAAVVATVVATVSALVVVGGCTPGTASASTGSQAVTGGADASTGAPSAGAPRAPLAAAPTTAVDPVRILAEVSAAGAGAGGTIAAVVLDADGTPMLSSADADEPRYTASLVKIALVSRLLFLDAAGAVTLSPDDLALMRSAVTASDDTAMSTLWDRYDGDRLVTDTAAALRLTSTAPPDVAGQWGQAWTSAADVATVLASLGDALGAQEAATLLGWMRATTPVGADGFDQRFGLLAGGAEDLAAKQGWMCCVDGRRQLHSAGVLSDGRVVVLLGDFPASTSWAQSSAALDRAADAVLAGID